MVSLAFVIPRNGKIRIKIMFSYCLFKMKLGVKKKQIYKFTCTCTWLFISFNWKLSLFFNQSAKCDPYTCFICRSADLQSWISVTVDFSLHFALAALHQMFAISQVGSKRCHLIFISYLSIKVNWYSVLR